jgi:DNA/RNA endonuclease YhcR with UshA esterase domain
VGETNIIELPPVDVGGDEEDIPVINKKPIKIKTKSYKSYENKLVQVEGEVTETSGRTFYLNDGSGKVKIYIQAATEIIKPSMHKGDIFQIIGVVNLYRNTWRILPRAQEDILLIRAKNENTTTLLPKSSVKSQATAKTKIVNGSASNARAPNLLTEPLIKEVKAAENQNTPNPQGQNTKTPLWLQIIKLFIGLAVVFMVLLLIKLKTMPRIKVIGGRFGQDDT